MSTDLVQARGAGQRAHGDVVLSTSVAELQATAYNLASACIHESRVRAQYVRDMLVFAVGADMAFDSLLPKPARL